HVLVSRQRLVEVQENTGNGRPRSQWFQVASRCVVACALRVGQFPREKFLQCLLLIRIWTAADTQVKTQLKFGTIGLRFLVNETCGQALCEFVELPVVEQGERLQRGV